MALPSSVALLGSLTLNAMAGVLQAACGASGRLSAGVGSEANALGRVTGTVRFVGVDCNPASRVVNTSKKSRLR